MTRIEYHREPYFRQRILILVSIVTHHESDLFKSIQYSPSLFIYSILDLLLTKQSILYMCEHPIKSLQYLYLDSILPSGCVL